MNSITNAKIGRTVSIDRRHPAFAGERSDLHHHSVPFADHSREILEDFREIAASFVLHGK